VSKNNTTLEYGIYAQSTYVSSCAFCLRFRFDTVSATSSLRHIPSTKPDGIQNQYGVVTKKRDTQ